ncbi:MAG: archaemetzincin [Desulfosudaceae bacterium]
MLRYWRYLILGTQALALVVSCGCGCQVAPVRLTVQQALDQGRRLAENKLPEPYQSLKPAYDLKREPAPGDWLEGHPEPPQSFSAYVRSRPRQPDSGRSILYLQPLLLPSGRTPAPTISSSLLEETRAFCAAMTGLTVRPRPALVIEELPPRARVEKSDGSRQVLSPWLLSEVLAEELPADGLGIIGVTTADLSPGAGYDFVYGQSSLSHGLAVVSLKRQGEPPFFTTEARRRHLRAVGHELGHLLGLRHCTTYECLMNGAANRQEADNRPFFMCPLCLRKLGWNLDLAPDRHLRELADFFRQRHLEEAARRAERLIRLLPPPEE